MIFLLKILLQSLLNYILIVPQTNVRPTHVKMAVHVHQDPVVTVAVVLQNLLDNAVNQTRSRVINYNFASKTILRKAIQD